MKELRFYKQFHGELARPEISYEEALGTLLTTYKDNDMTRDLLTVPNNIQCRFSTIYVEEYDTEHPNYPPVVYMAGCFNNLPDHRYDDDGRRIE